MKTKDLNNGTPVEKLKGEFVTRKPNGKSIYQVIGYCRYNRKYELQNVNDVNHYSYVKKGTRLFIAEY